MARKTRSAKTKSKPAPATSTPSRATKGAGKVKKQPPAPVAPLLATSPKKVGRVKPPKDNVPAAKPARTADYQPKTDVPKAAKEPVHPHPASTPPAMAPLLDPFALMRPWIHIGLRATAASLTLQARMMRAAMALPPTTMAMRQTTQALDMWHALARPTRPAPRKD